MSKATNKVLAALRKDVAALKRNQVRLRQGVMDDEDSVVVGGASVAKAPTKIVGTGGIGDRVSVFTAGRDALALQPSSGTVDSRTARHLVKPIGDTQNGVVVKAPSEDWKDTDYGEAQAFLLLREDYATDPGYGDNVEPDKNVLFRVDGHTGGIGTTGGIHSALGARQHDDFSALVNTWLDNSMSDSLGLLIQAHSSPTKSWITCTDNAGTRAVLDMTKDGWLNIRAMSGNPGALSVARGGGTQGNGVALIQEETAGGVITGSAIGDGVLRVPSTSNRLLFGTGATDLFAAYGLTGYAILAHAGSTSYAFANDSAGEVKINAPSGQKVKILNTNTEVINVGLTTTEINNVIQLTESSDPVNAGTDKAYLFIKDNGSGKTQLCVKFSSGSSQVIATQP